MFQDLPRYINYRDILLQKAKDYYQKIKKREKNMQEIDIET